MSDRDMRIGTGGMWMMGADGRPLDLAAAIASAMGQGRRPVLASYSGAIKEAGASQQVWPLDEDASDGMLMNASDTDMWANNTGPAVVNDPTGDSILLAPGDVFKADNPNALNVACAVAGKLFTAKRG